MTSAAAALFALSACGSGEINYTDYISEKRDRVYLYEDDNLTVKVQLTSRESPYLSDGYKGDMQDICEIFVKFSQSPENVTATPQSKSDRFSLSSSMSEVLTSRSRSWHR